MATTITPPPQPTIPAEQSQYPVIGPGFDYDTVEQKIDDIVLERPLTKGWVVGFFGAATLLLLGHYTVVRL